MNHLGEIMASLVKKISLANELLSNRYDFTGTCYLDGKATVTIRLLESVNFAFRTSLSTCENSKNDDVAVTKRDFCASIC